MEETTSLDPLSQANYTFVADRHKNESITAKVSLVPQRITNGSQALLIAQNLRRKNLVTQPIVASNCNAGSKRKKSFEKARKQEQTGSYRDIELLDRISTPAQRFAAKQQNSLKQYQSCQQERKGSANAFSGRSTDMDVANLVQSSKTALFPAQVQSTSHLTLKKNINSDVHFGTLSQT